MNRSHSPFLSAALATGLLVLALVVPASRSFAAVPALMNYQGYLADNSGNPLSGTYAISFKLYPDSTTGSPLWTESYASVAVTSGVFNVLLGSLSPLGPNVLTGARLWLLTTVNGNDVLPRRPIVTVAYAFRAAVADSALKVAPGTGDITGQVQVTCAGSASGALVYVPGRSFIAYTASDGTFDLGAMPPGTYALHIITSNSSTADVAGVTVTAGNVTNAGIVAVGANLQTDVNNCGSCGVVCSSNHDTPSCVAGSCQLACNTGYANCDLSASNGCEVSTATDPANCGNCGNVCSSQNAQASCVSGVCTVGSCNAGFANCDGNPSNGCETSIYSDLSNCGACGNVCPSEPNSNTTCSAGSCQLMCNAGYLNCNGFNGDGCEINTTSDPNNCGGCGHVCGGVHVCVNSVCQ